MVCRHRGVDTPCTPVVLIRVPAASLQSLNNKPAAGHSKEQAEALGCSQSGGIVESPKPCPLVFWRAGQDMVTCVGAVPLGGEEVVACPSPGTAKYQACNLPYPGGLRIDGWGGLAWGQLLVWLLTPRNISGPHFLCLSSPNPNSGWPQTSSPT